MFCFYPNNPKGLRGADVIELKTKVMCWIYSDVADIMSKPCRSVKTVVLLPKIKAMVTKKLKFNNIF